MKREVVLVKVGKEDIGGEEIKEIEQPSQSRKWWRITMKNRVVIETTDHVTVWYVEE